LRDGPGMLMWAGMRDLRTAAYPFCLEGSRRSAARVRMIDELAPADTSEDAGAGPEDPSATAKSPAPAPAPNPTAEAGRNPAFRPRGGRGGQAR